MYFSGNTRDETAVMVFELPADVSDYLDCYTRRATRNGDYGAFKKDASITDPVDPAKNVPWLQLSKVEGDLASFVYRVNTAGGIPPATVSIPLITTQV